MVQHKGRDVGELYGGLVTLVRLEPEDGNGRVISNEELETLFESRDRVS